MVLTRFLKHVDIAGDNKEGISKVGRVEQNNSRRDAKI